MKNIVLVFVLLLAGCGGNVVPTFSGALEPEIAKNRGIVVIGLSLNPRRAPIGTPLGMTGAWAQIEPTTRDVMPIEALMFDIDGGPFATSAVLNGTRYDFYSLAGGTYALAFIGIGMETYLPTEFAEVRVTASGGFSARRWFSKQGRATPLAPSFTIRPGEVVYVGDLAVDLTEPYVARWSVKNSEDAVMKEFADRGFKGSPSVRLLTRVDGAPIGEQKMESRGWRIVR